MVGIGSGTTIISAVKTLGEDCSVVPFRKLDRHTHYQNLPMQYMEIFSSAKIENFIRKFLIFLLKT